MFSVVLNLFRRQIKEIVHIQYFRKLHINRFIYQTYGLQYIEKFKHINDPQRSISDLFTLAVQVDPCINPDLHLTQSKYLPDYWKCQLDLKWPFSFKVSGRGFGKEKAIVQAYLEACFMYQQLGLLDKFGNIVDCKKLLSDMYEYYVIVSGYRPTLEYRSTKQAGDAFWTSTVSINYPKYIKTSGVGFKQSTAEIQAARLAVIELTNTQAVGPYGNRQFLSYLTMPFLSEHVTINDTHYIICTDASLSGGYGAYLIAGPKTTGEMSKIDIANESSLCSLSSNNNKIAWYRSSWTTRQKDPLNTFTSSCAELFAITEAVFTWKHKFKGKVVYVRTDSMCCCQIINVGKSMKHLKKKGLYFEMLREICYRYGILLRAVHVSRYDNQMADALSCNKIDYFLTRVPNANAQMKKKKNLPEKILCAKSMDNDVITYKT